MPRKRLIAVLVAIYCHKSGLKSRILETMVPPDDRESLRREVHG
jgi:hypothetical protein